ncbi:MAG: gliding motility-associated C-terminal domain-containing protein [Spirochaetia bacterium]|nr:gliding motility-associated C-terminal domain-containing protein [Spirochaetia bacterium]
MELSKKIQFSLVFLIIFLTVGQLSAGGNKEMPDVPPITSGTQYFSPDSNGVQDTAILSFSVKVYVKSDDGYVPEYGLQILDSSGNVMKEIVETEKSDIGWFTSIFRGYSEFALERSISWDGTDKDGNVAADGTYNVKLWVVDSSKNRKDIDVDNFWVDVRKPEAIIVEPTGFVFSPNGDDFLDVIEIGHTQATVEALWEASVLDEGGNIVKSFTWENVSPGKAVWDGKDNSGLPVPAGTYSYTLSSKDEAGNESDPIILEGITLDMTLTAIELVIDNPAISPDGNGIKDSMTIYMDQAVKEEIESWEWSIRNVNSTVYWQVTGDGAVPEEVVFDGTDSNGNAMPEGNYNFAYIVTYKNGNRPTALEPFVIDVSAPDISVAVTNPVFSPNGDGLKDEAEIKLKSNEIVIWEGRILDSTGEAVVSTNSDSTTSLIVWDGNDKDGVALTNGNYTLVATFTDAAGNSASIDPSSLNLNRDPVAIALRTSKGFSPDDDGASDDLIVLVDSNLYDNLENWKLNILDTENNIIRSIGGFDILPPEIIWDGTVLYDDGKLGIAEEGKYKAELSANYLKGDSVTALSDSFVLDNTAPEIFVDVASNPFATTDDGVEGEVYVTLKVIDNTDISNWSMDVLNTEGDILRSYSGSGDPSGDITWNSMESNGGTTVSIDNPDFVLKLTVIDLGGNESVFEKDIPLDILLVIKDGKKFLSVPNIIFGAYKHTLASAGAVQLKSNNSSLDKVFSIYQKYPAYGLILEGHALNIYLEGSREDREEKILLPLTENRAVTVKDALIKRGLEESKISAEAFGGQFPIASVSDETVWGKNRRVEFVMTDPVE